MDDLKSCFICGMDLMELPGPSTRELHLNECLDKPQTKKTERKKSFIKQKSMDFGEDVKVGKEDQNSEMLPVYCPSCSVATVDLKISKQSAMWVHMKQCAKKNKVDIAQVISDLQDMRENGQLISEAEISGKISCVKQKTKQLKLVAKAKETLRFDEVMQYSSDDDFAATSVIKRNSVSLKNNAGKKDPDLQLALALSASDAPAKTKLKKRNSEEMCAVLPAEEAQMLASGNIAEILIASEQSPAKKRSQAKSQIRTTNGKRFLWDVAKLKEGKGEEFLSSIVDHLKENLEPFEEQFSEIELDMDDENNIEAISLLFEELYLSFNKSLQSFGKKLSKLSKKKPLTKTAQKPAKVLKFKKEVAKSEIVSSMDLEEMNMLSIENQDDDLDLKITEILKNDKDTYEKILMYEQIEINQIKEKLEENGIKLTKKRLQEYLDLQSLTYTDEMKPSWKSKRTQKKK